MKKKTIPIDYKGSKLKISSNFQNGGNKSIVLIHGLGCTKESFKDIWNFPYFKDFSVLSFDLLGFGDSSKPRNFSYKIEEHTKICELVIEKLNLKNIHLVGHSMSGTIGLFLLKRTPKKFISFTNLEGNLIGEDCSISRKTTSVPYEEFEKSYFNKLKMQRKESKDKSDKLWYSWMCKSSPFAFYHSAKSLVKWSDTNKILKLFLKIDNKKTFIYGENSVVPSLKLIKGKIPIIKISNSGHFMMTDNPKEFYKKLAKNLI